MAGLVVAGAAAAMGRIANTLSRDKLPPPEPACELSADSAETMQLPKKALSAVSLPTYLPVRTRSTKSDGELDGCSVVSAGGESADSADGDSSASDADGGTANLRDIAQLHSPDTIRAGRLFRCSQFHSVELRTRLGIKAVLDLRKTGKACQGFGNKSKEVYHPEWTWLRAKNLMPNEKPPRCPICETQLNKSSTEEHHVEVRVPGVARERFACGQRGHAAHLLCCVLHGRVRRRGIVLHSGPVATCLGARAAVLTVLLLLRKDAACRMVTAH